MERRVTVIEKICRFCLGQEGLIALREATTTLFSIQDVILYTGIQISCVRLPYVICHKCRTTINSSIQFRRACMKSNNMFKRVVEMLKTNMLDDLNSLETISVISPTDTINAPIIGPSHDSDPDLMPSLDIGTTEKPTNNAIGSEFPVDTSNEHIRGPSQYDNEIVVLDDSDSDLLPSLMETTEKPTNNAGGSQLYSDSICNSSTNNINGNMTIMSSTVMESEIGKQAEESIVEPLDGNDSDYSVTSLFGEAMQEISTIETESAESAKCPTEENGHFRTSSVACEETHSVIESNIVESNAMLPDGSDSDDSVVSLYKEVVGDKLSKASRACQKEKVKFHGKQLCFICGSLQRDLNNHMKMTHIKTKKFSCPHCPKTFVRRFEVLLHINTSHKKNIIYSCEHCGKGFTNRNSYYYHMVNSHRKSALHECNICHRKLKSWDGYQKHLKTHSLTSHPCPDCDKLFKTTATLEQHITRYHAT